MTLFIRNMPFRGLVKLSNGLADTEMALGILEMANGRGFRGFVHTVKALFAKNRARRARKKRLGL